MKYFDENKGMNFFGQYFPKLIMPNGTREFIYPTYTVYDILMVYTNGIIPLTVNSKFLAYTTQHYNKRNG